MTGMVGAGRRTHPAAFLVGGVMGLMAVMAAGLILYEGSGLLRAVTVVLTTEAAAAAAGLLFAARVPAEDIPRQLRRHLHLALMSLGLAGVLASLWGYYGGLSGVWGGQAAALALLAALPLYMNGSVLGLVCRTAAAVGEGKVVAGAGFAMLGAATGFLVHGLFLFPDLAPPVLVLLCMAAVSGAALLQVAGGGLERTNSADPDIGGAPAENDEPGALPAAEEPEASRDPPMHAILEGSETSVPEAARNSRQHSPEGAEKPES